MGKESRRNKQFADLHQSLACDSYESRQHDDTAKENNGAYQLE